MCSSLLNNKLSLCLSILLYTLLSSYGYSLAEICNQLLEFYEEIGIPLSQGSEAEVAVGGRTKSPASNEQAWKQISTHPVPQHSSAENNAIQFRVTKNQSTDGSKEMGSDITDCKMDLKTKDSQNSKKLPNIVAGDRDRMVGGNLDLRESLLGDSPKESVKMIDKDKSKAELEKRRNDLIEMKLEDGVELALENEKNKRERRQNWSKTDDENGRQMSMKGQLQKDMNEYIAEEGEVIDDDISSLLNSHKRKMDNSPPRQPEMKRQLIRNI